MDAHQSPNRERSVCLAYAITGSTYLTLGLPGLLIGTFTGPHIFVAAFGFILLGAMCVVVAFGLPFSSRRTCVLGIAVAAINTAVSLFAAFATLFDDAATWPVAFFWLAIAAPLAVAGISLLRTERQTRHQSPTPAGLQADPSIRRSSPPATDPG